MTTELAEIVTSQPAGPALLGIVSQGTELRLPASRMRASPQHRDLCKDRARLCQAPTPRQTPAARSGPRAQYTEP